MILIFALEDFKCAWLGVVPYQTHGPDNTPGVSIRTSYLPTKVGTYSITEKVYIPSISSNIFIVARDSLQQMLTPPLHS